MSNIHGWMLIFLLTCTLSKTLHLIPLTVSYKEDEITKSLFTRLYNSSMDIDFGLCLIKFNKHEIQIFPSQRQSNDIACDAIITSSFNIARCTCWVVWWPVDSNSQHWMKMQWWHRELSRCSDVQFYLLCVCNLIVRLYNLRQWQIVNWQGKPHPLFDMITNWLNFTQDIRDIMTKRYMYIQAQKKN